MLYRDFLKSIKFDKICGEYCGEYKKQKVSGFLFLYIRFSEKRIIWTGKIWLSYKDIQ